MLPIFTQKKVSRTAAVRCVASNLQAGVLSSGAVRHENTADHAFICAMPESTMPKSNAWRTGMPDEEFSNAASTRPKTVQPAQKARCCAGVKRFVAITQLNS